MPLSIIFHLLVYRVWRLVLLVEETVVPGENHRSAARHCQTLLHNVVLSTPRKIWVRTGNISGECLNNINKYNKRIQ